MALVDSKIYGGEEELFGQVTEGNVLLTHEDKQLVNKLIWCRKGCVDGHTCLYRYALYLQYTSASDIPNCL